MKALKRILSVLLIAVMLCGGAMAATAYKANVISSYMEVYNYSKQHIGSLPRGTEFWVLDISDSGNWAKIYYKGAVGYTSMQNIMFENRIPVMAVKDASICFVTKNSYKQGKAYKANIAAGTTVYMVGYFDGTLLVESASGGSLGIVDASSFKKL